MDINPSRRGRGRISRESDEFVFAVLYLFLTSDQSVADLAAEIKRRWERPWFTREQVYEGVREALYRKFLVFRPPFELIAAQRIVDLSGLYAEPACQVQVTSPSGTILVAAAAAHAMFERLAWLVGQGRREIRIGIGAGPTVQESIKTLAALLRSEPSRPDFLVVPLAGADDQKAAPASLASYLDLNVNKVTVAPRLKKDQPLDLAVREMSEEDPRVLEHEEESLRGAGSMLLLAGPSADVARLIGSLTSPVFDRLIVDSQVAQDVIAELIRRHTAEQPPEDA